ncbi:hypothetical protein HYT05_04690 [Candidatus Kaiserbacteria bacterium]|nr:hypothetical protein [Candidatus Kaiserbacteria bacterium]
MQGVGLSVAYAQTPTSTATTDSGFWESFWKWNNNTNVFGSLLRPAFASIAALLIQLAVVILQIASGLFDILVMRTIIGFGAADGLLNPSVINAINIAWSAFRDLSNILIVGFFTFIALNIILGSPTFGQKRLIANVLIVAILINFSLLFTKIIIDFSNYTATQFYVASVGRAPATSGGTATTPQSIGDRFIFLTKATSLSDAAKSIDTVGSESGNWFMLLYAIVLFGIIIGAAAVLFYGSFILVSRAILMIFLMVTAALAFATYLMPSNSPLNQWGTWWKSLIQSAVLAPILIIFLWATLKISEGLFNINNGSGTLGDLAKHPETASNIGALFSYIIILALLFAAFKVASSFSMSIAGFNWASVMPAVTLAGGSRFAASTLRGGSWAAGKGLNAVGNRLSASNSRLATLGGGLLNATGKGLNAFSAKQLNLMNTPAGALAAKQTGGITSQKVLAGAPRAPIGSSAASQRAAKAITDAWKNRNKGVTGPTGTAIAKTPPTPPGGAAALPRPAAAALPAPKPATPAPTTAGASGTSRASGMAPTDIAQLEKAVKEGGEDRVAATRKEAEQVAGERATTMEEMKRVISERSADTAGKEAELVKTLKEGMATQLTATKEAMGEQTEKLGGKLERVGSQVETAAGGTREALIGVEKTVKETGQKAADIGTQQLDTQKQKEEIDRNASIERGTSDNRTRNYEQSQRTALAQEQANARLQHLVEIRNQQAQGNYGPLIKQEEVAPQASLMAPMNTSAAATASFAAQPYTQTSVSQPNPGIAQHQSTLNADTLLKEIRENRERNAKQLRDQFRVIKGGKDDQPK